MVTAAELRRTIDEFVEGNGDNPRLTGVVSDLKEASAELQRAGGTDEPETPGRSAARDVQAQIADARKETGEKPKEETPGGGFPSKDAVREQFGGPGARGDDDSRPPFERRMAKGRATARKGAR